MCQNCLKSGIEYVSIGNIKKGEKKEPEKNENDYNMDILKCEGIIRSSFKFDYNYDPYEMEYLHWYEFYNDLENLSTSEFGNCCIYNRITGILNQKASEIKESKERTKLIKTQKELKKKYCILNNKEKELDEKEKENVVDFYKQIGLWKEAEGGKSKK